MRTQFLIATSLLTTSTLWGASLWLAPMTSVQAMTDQHIVLSALDNDAGTIVQSTSPSSWREFSSTSGNFTVKAPNKPEESESKEEDGGKSYSFAFYQDSNFYYIRYSDNPAFQNNFNAEQIKEVLAAAPAAFAQGSGGKIIGQRAVTLANHQGIEFDFRIKDVNGQGRAYLVKGRLYMLVGAGEMTNTQAFLNSFQLINSGIK